MGFFFPVFLFSGAKKFFILVVDIHREQTSIANTAALTIFNYAITQHKNLHIHVIKYEKEFWGVRQLCPRQKFIGPEGYRQCHRYSNPINQFRTSLC